MPDIGTQKKHDRLLLISVSSIFIASFYFSLNLGGAGLMVPNASTIWIAATAMIAMGALMLLSSDEIELPRYWIWLGLLPIGLVLSGLFSDTFRPIQWALRVGYLLGGFLFFFLLFQYHLSRRGAESLLFLIALTSFLHSSVVLLQIYGGEWLYGWIPFKTGNEHIGGMFQQINLVASFAATGLCTSAYLMTTPGYRGRSTFYKIILYCNVALLMAIILHTGSRTGLLGAGIGLLLLVFARYRFLFRNKTTLVALLVALSAGVSFGNHLSQDTEKLEVKFQREGFENARLVVYRLSWELFLEKPFFGHGIGSFSRVFQEKRVAFQKEYPQAHLAPKMYSHPHNEILFWLVENGVVAVAGMIALMAATLLQLLSLGWQRGVAYAALILPVSLHVLVELPFYLSPLHWFIWLIILYLIHHHHTVFHANSMSSSARRFLSFSVITAALVLFVFFMHTLYSINRLARYAESGARDVAELARAAKNPALMDIGEAMLMSSLLYKDILTGHTNNATRFVDWAEEFVSHTPSPMALADLALAYAYLGKEKDAKRVIDAAVLIYPKSEMLIERKEQISAGTLIGDFRARHKRGRAESSASG